MWIQELTNFVWVSTTSGACKPKKGGSGTATLTRYPSNIRSLNLKIIQIYITRYSSWPGGEL